MDPSLLATLRVHNPWLDHPDRQRELLARTLPDPYVPRRKRLDLRPGLVELVVGPRQAGKSTWIRASLSTLDDPLLILHAEEPRIRELGESPALTLDALTEVLGPRTVLLLEEVQHLPNAPLLLKGLVDLAPERRIVATGSSSLQLRARTRESLAGRARRTLLLPFSLAEVAASLPSGLAPAIHDARLTELWARLVVGGGYPGPWFDPDPELALRRLVEAFVLRDATDLHTIDRPAAFRRLVELAASDIGNLVNLSKWAEVAQVSRGTAERYLGIAEDAQVLRLVHPFVGGRRAEVTGTPKVYLLDNGLRNALVGGFLPEDRRTDRGPLWENGVFTELLKSLDLLDEVRYWRSKNGAEVDFVVRRGERLVAVEVKAGSMSRPRLSRAARSFVEAYQPELLAVVNGSLRLDTEVDGVPVAYVRPWELPSLLHTQLNGTAAIRSSGSSSSSGSYPRLTPCRFKGEVSNCKVWVGSPADRLTPAPSPAARPPPRGGTRRSR